MTISQSNDDPYSRPSSPDKALRTPQPNVPMVLNTFIGPVCDMYSSWRTCRRKQHKNAWKRCEISSDAGKKLPLATTDQEMDQCSLFRVVLRVGMLENSFDKLTPLCLRLIKILRMPSQVKKPSKTS